MAHWILFALTTFSIAAPPFPIQGNGAKVKTEIKAITVEDSVMEAYKKSTTLPEFLKAIAPQLLPGDDELVLHYLGENPEIQTLKKIPVVNRQGDYFTIEMGGKQIGIRFADLRNFDFEVNHHLIHLFPGEVSKLRWDLIGENLKTVGLEDASAITVAQIVALLFTSAMSHGHANTLNLKVGYKESFYPFFELWHKSGEQRTQCDNELLLELSKKMSDLQVTTLRCDNVEEEYKPERFAISNSVTQFQIALPGKTEGVEGGTRYIFVDSLHASARENAPDLGVGALNYGRSEKPDDPSSLWQKTKFGKKVRTTRDKGMDWHALSGSDNFTTYLRSQQLRELFETAYKLNFCGRCGSLLKSAAHAASDAQKYSTGTKLKVKSKRPVINAMPGANPGVMPPPPDGGMMPPPNIPMNNNMVPPPPPPTGTGVNPPPASNGVKSTNPNNPSPPTDPLAMPPLPNGP